MNESERKIICEKDFDSMINCFKDKIINFNCTNIALIVELSATREDKYLIDTHLIADRFTAAYKITFVIVLLNEHNMDNIVINAEFPTKEGYLQLMDNYLIKKENIKYFYKALLSMIYNIIDNDYIIFQNDDDYLFTKNINYLNIYKNDRRIIPPKMGTIYINYYDDFYFIIKPQEMKDQLLEQIYKLGSGTYLRLKSELENVI